MACLVSVQEHPGRSRSKVPKKPIHFWLADWLSCLTVTRRQLDVYWEISIALTQVVRWIGAWRKRFLTWNAIATNHPLALTVELSTIWPNPQPPSLQGKGANFKASLKSRRKVWREVKTVPRTTENRYINPRIDIDLKQLSSAFQWTMWWNAIHLPTTKRTNETRSLCDSSHTQTSHRGKRMTTNKITKPKKEVHNRVETPFFYYLSRSTEKTYAT